MQAPDVHYARSADGTHIAYQVAGDGPIDLLMIAPAYSNIELFWTNPSFGPFLVALGIDRSSRALRPPWGRPLRPTDGRSASDAGDAGGGRVDGDGGRGLRATGALRHGLDRAARDLPRGDVSGPHRSARPVRDVRLRPAGRGVSVGLERRGVGRARSRGRGALGTARLRGIVPAVPRPHGAPRSRVDRALDQLLPPGGESGDGGGAEPARTGDRRPTRPPDGAGPHARHASEGRGRLPRSRKAATWLATSRGLGSSSSRARTTSRGTATWRR